MFTTDGAAFYCKICDIKDSIEEKYTVHQLFTKNINNSHSINQPIDSNNIQLRSLRRKKGFISHFSILKIIFS